MDFRVKSVIYKGTKKISTTTTSPFKQLADQLSVVSGNNLEDYKDSKYDSDSFQPSTAPKPPPSGQLNQKEPNIPSPNQILFAHPAPVHLNKWRGGTDVRSQDC